MAAFLNSQVLLTDIQVFTPDFFYKLENVTIDKKALFILALGRQLRTFFLLLLLSSTAMKKPLLYSYPILQGGFIGTTMDLLLILYGLTGMGIYILLVLPHGIFYFLSYSILLVQKLKEGEEEKEAYIFLQKKKERRQKLFMALVLLVIGSITEAYCNLFILFH